MSVGGPGAEQLLELSLSAEPASCGRARHEICAALQGRGIDTAAVALAVSEAVSNAVLHAYRDRDGPTAEQRVDVLLTADVEGVWVVVADEGVGMSPRDDSPGLGLGLSVIARLSDELLIVQGETGTRLHIRFRFTGARVDEPR
jgi:serine/threonine-protein kinase RsbW